MRINFLNSKTITTVILVLLAVILTYFSKETQHEVKEVTKEVKLIGVS